jgi:hypothetical protein
MPDLMLGVRVMDKTAGIRFPRHVLGHAAASCWGFVVVFASEILQCMGLCSSARGLSSVVSAVIP